MRKLAIKFLFMVDGALHFFKVSRGTFLWKVNGVLLRKLKRTFVKIHGFEMFLDKRDSLGLSLTEFEPETVIIFKQFVKPGDTVLNVGANIGYFSLLASKLGASVLAFEPEPESFSLLKKNIAHNNSKISAFNNAVSDKNQRVKLYLNPDNLAGHSLNQRKENQKYIEVEAVVLDDFIDPDKKIDFVKIDIEGEEYRAFLGMRRILADNPGIKIIAEYHNYHQLVDLLVEQGFKLYTIESKGLRSISAEDLKRENRGINIFCKR